jgi:hypothetical protein
MGGQESSVPTFNGEIDPPQFPTVSVVETKVRGVHLIHHREMDRVPVRKIQQGRPTYAVKFEQGLPITFTATFLPLPRPNQLLVQSPVWPGRLVKIFDFLDRESAKGTKELRVDTPKSSDLSGGQHVADEWYQGAFRKTAVGKFSSAGEVNTSPEFQKFRHNEGKNVIDLL